MEKKINKFKAWINSMWTHPRKFQMKLNHVYCLKMICNCDYEEKPIQKKTVDSLLFHKKVHVEGWMQDGSMWCLYFTAFRTFLLLTPRTLYFLLGCDIFRYSIYAVSFFPYITYKLGFECCIFCSLIVYWYTVTLAAWKLPSWKYILTCSAVEGFKWNSL